MAHGEMELPAMRVYAHTYIPEDWWSNHKQEQRAIGCIDSYSIYIASLD